MQGGEQETEEGKMRGRGRGEEKEMEGGRKRRRGGERFQTPWLRRRSEEQRSLDIKH